MMLENGLKINLPSKTKNYKKDLRKGETLNY